jgi:hypothetical protein
VLRLPTEGRIWDVVADGSFAYAAEDGLFVDGIRVLDLRVPAAPVLLDLVPSPGVRYLAMDGRYLYAMDSIGTLRVYDASKNGRPHLLATLDTRPLGGGSGPFVFSEGYLYVAAGEEGLMVLDVLKPASPRLASLSLQTSTYEVRGVGVRGRFAYVGHRLSLDLNSEQLSVLDISSPSHPTEVRRIPVPGRPVSSVLFSGNVLYGLGGGLSVMDISNPSNPVDWGLVDAPLIAATVRGEHLIGTTLRGLGSYDLSVPLNPTLAGSEPRVAMHAGLGCAVGGDYAYLAEWSAGLAILDVRDPVRMKEVARVPAKDTVDRVVVYQDRLYFTDGKLVRMLNVSDPANPRALGEFAPFGTTGYVSGLSIAGPRLCVWGSEVAVYDLTRPFLSSLWARVSNVSVGAATCSGAYLYVGGSKTLAIFDITKQNQPVLRSSKEVFYGLSAGTRGIAVQGDYAYLATEERALWVVDASDPSRPVARWSYALPGVAFDVSIVDQRAFVAIGDLNWVGRSRGVAVFDISTPAAFPRLIGGHFLPIDGAGARQVVAIGDRAFVADDGLGLLAIDLSALAEPQLERTWGIQTDNQAHVAGDMAYTVSGRSLQAYNLADPNSPRPLGSYVASAAIGSIRVEGTRAFLGLSLQGFVEVDLSTPGQPQFKRQVAPSGNDIAIAGGVACVADGEAGVRFYYLSGAASPLPLLGSIEAGGQGEVEHVAVSGSLAFVTGNGDVGFQVIDFIDPVHPKLRGRIAAPWSPDYRSPVGLVASGRWVYFPDRLARIHAVDVGNPDAPVVRASVDAWRVAPVFYPAITRADLSGRAWDGILRLKDDRLYYAGGLNGMSVIDVSDPGQPRVLGRNSSLTEVMSVSFDGDDVYAANRGGPLGRFRGRPHFTQFSRSGFFLRLEWNTEGWPSRLERATRLVNPDWTPVTVAKPGTNVNVLIDRNANAFYRLVPP